MSRMIKEVGNWVSGDRFFDREPEVAQLVELLEEGAHVMILAQRRMGKTSLMREVGNRLSDRFDCLQIDLQSSWSGADAVVELSLATRPYQKLWGRTKSLFHNVLQDVTETVESVGVDELTARFRSGVAGDWQRRGRALLEQLSKNDRLVVVFLDELPVLVNRLAKGPDFQLTPERRRDADAFVSWLRAASIEHRGRISFVVAGSIGLEPVLSQVGLSATLNTFTPLELPPWSAEVARACCEALAQSYELKFGEGALEAMLERLGSFIPHHVQLFFSHVYEACRHARHMTATPELVDEVYRTRMLSTRGHAELRTYQDRLAMVISNDRLPLVLDLLTEAAVVGSLTARSASILATEHLTSDPRRLETLHSMLEILEHDGYLDEENDRYRFVSHLLRDWWKARFSFGYVPADQRGA